MFSVYGENESVKPECCDEGYNLGTLALTAYVSGVIDAGRRQSDFELTTSATAPSHGCTPPIASLRTGAAVIICFGGVCRRSRRPHLRCLRLLRASYACAVCLGRLIFYATIILRSVCQAPRPSGRYVPCSRQAVAIGWLQTGVTALRCEALHLASAAAPLSPPCRDSRAASAALPLRAGALLLAALADALLNRRLSSTDRADDQISSMDQIAFAA